MRRIPLAGNGSSEGSTYPDDRIINADCNGPGNIIRKVAPNAFGSEGVEDEKELLASLVVHPVRMILPITKPKSKQSVIFTL